MQVEVAEHAELEGGVLRPVRVGFGDCDCVEVMEDEFHGQKTDQEAEGVEEDPLAVDGGELVALLGDVIVEGEDWAGEVEGGVEDVGDVVAEAEVLGVGRGVDSLALGVVGGIDVFLLKCVSFVSW